MVYVKVDSESRLIAMAGPGFHCGPGEIAVAKKPDNIHLHSIRDYVLKDGELIFDPLPQEPAQEDTEPAETLLLEMAADHEYRLCLLELGVNADDL